MVWTLNCGYWERVADLKESSKGSNNMRHIRAIPSLAAAVLLVAGCLMVPTLASAAPADDSPQITKLLADARAEAAELRADSADLESMTKSKVSWESHAAKVEMIKEHVNKTAKLLTSMKDASGGSAWQQTAVQRIEPLLKELAANTEATINHLNANHARVHMPAFRDYAKANFELASDLESLIRKFADYSEAKEKFERLGAELEVS